MALGLACLDFGLVWLGGSMPARIGGLLGAADPASLAVEPGTLLALALAASLGPLLAGRPETGHGAARFLRASASASLGFVLLLLLLPLALAPSWPGLAAALTVGLGGGCLARVVLWRVVRHGAGSALAPRAVLVGAGPGLARLEAHFVRHPEAARIEAVLAHGAGPAGAERIEEQLLSLVRDRAVDQVLLALPADADALLATLLRALSHQAVDVRLLVEPPGLAQGTAPILLGVSFRPIAGWAALLKAASDYGIAGLLVLLTLPLLAVIALAIRLDSQGPVLFRQRRTGFNNRDFDILKFRTMHVPQGGPRRPGEAEPIVQATRDDKRVTRVGRFLRRTSLDELPQLVNVLRGEMSVVGPRPHAPSTRASGRLFQEIVAGYAARHRVKPGLTGFAQVNGWRGETSTEEQLVRRIECDLHYIANWSIWLDFTILLRTARVLFGSRNAY